MRNEKDLKCVLCGMEAEYVRDGMSLCEKHFKAQQIGDKEIDLVKIQTYADRCHTILTIGLSFAFVVFSLFAVFATLYYQSLMAFNFYFVNVYNVGMTVVSSLFVITYWIFFRKYRKDFRRISRMLNAVQKGEHLPDLDKLEEWETSRTLFRKRSNP
jgi:hypothetical protein